MNKTSQLKIDLEVGDQVRLIPETLAWRAEIKLQGKIGEVIELDGRISVRFDNGRLLRNRDAAEAFERVAEIGLKAKGK